MSIFDPQETIYNRAEIACQLDNPLHLNVSDSEYEYLRAVYYPIRNLYQWFFAKYCSDENLDLVNANIEAELIRSGVYSTSSNRPIFATKEDLDALRRYVMTRSYPASYEDMKQFIIRVFRGDLEFLCRYPNEDGISSFDKIKNTRYSNW